VPGLTILRPCFLNALIADDFDVEGDRRVTLDLSDTPFTCDQLVIDTSISGASGAQDRDPLTLPLNTGQTLCEIRRDPADLAPFFQLEEVGVDICAIGFEFNFLDFELPSFTTGKIVYISSPD
jgi:hypothetical protein